MTLPKKRRHLTAVETDIVRLVSRGYANVEIADLLGLANSGMSRRLDTIQTLIGIPVVHHGGRGAVGISRVRLTIWAYENGIAMQNVTEYNDAPRTGIYDTSTEHGSYEGWQRHKQARDRMCEACAAAKRGYDVGVRDGAKQTAADSAANRLAERAFAVCRALVLRRPVPWVREQAVAIIRERDAELAGDDPTWQAVA